MMTARGNRALAARAPDEIHERVEAAADRAEVDKSAWILEAVIWALEVDEAALAHVPAVVADATPKRVPGGIRIPKGRVFDRYPL